jgi:aerobic C4-dicarboxylate transport protein
MAAQQQASDKPDHGNGAGKKQDRTHYLYMAVIAAVLLGILVGFVAPEFAVALEPLGEAFVALITMMIQPVIFCTIVLGVGSVRSAAQVGKVGGRASAGTPGYSGRLPPAPPMVYGVV